YTSFSASRKQKEMSPRRSTYERKSSSTRVTTSLTPAAIKVAAARTDLEVMISNVVMVWLRARQANANHSVEYPALVPISIHEPSGDDAAKSARKRPVSGGTW